MVKYNEKLSYLGTDQEDKNFSLEESRIIAFERLLASLSYHDLTPALKEDLIDVFIADQQYFGFPIQSKNIVYVIAIASNPTQNIFVVGDFNSWNGNDPMYQLKNAYNTKLFYLKKQFELDARLDYKIIIGHDWKIDPLNAKQIRGGFGPNSELVMPGYTDDKSYYPIVEKIIPQGTIKYYEKFIDHTQDDWARKITIYLPPGYNKDTEQRYASFYAADGSDYLLIGNIKNVLDYNIYYQRIPPVIGIFIDPISPSWRVQEYSGSNCNLIMDHEHAPNKAKVCKQKYAEFVAKELVPFIDAHFNTIQAPESRAHLGCSLGGSMSTYLSLLYPETFKLVGSQSGSFWIDPLLQQQFSHIKKINGMRFYLNAGTYEERVNTYTGYLAEILKDKGYPVLYKQYHQGHSWGQWRATFGEMLEFLFLKTSETDL